MRTKAYYNKEIKKLKKLSKKKKREALYWEGG